jgi:hypothetical protein
MCANCVTKLDVVVGSIGLGAYLLHGPVKAKAVELGILPEPHPLAVEMRTVAFLRDLDLDPAEILGPEVVEAVDAATAWEPRAAYRRSSAGRGAMRSHSAEATQ